MTEHHTRTQIRTLVDFISELLVKKIEPTEENARLLQEADCLLVGVVSLLSKATDTPSVFCSYTACGKSYCSELPAGVCATRHGRAVGACADARTPGVDTAVRAEHDAHKCKKD